MWTHYGQLQRDFRWAYYSGAHARAACPAQEYASIPWEKYERGDPAFLNEIYRRIAYREGELGDAFAEGCGRLAARWKFPPEYFADPAQSWWKMGHPRHHAAEEGGQAGVLINLMYNRDAQCHSHSNFLGCGLPTRVQQAIAAKVWGEGAIDEPDDCRPMTPAKARFAVWARAAQGAARFADAVQLGVAARRLAAEGARLRRRRRRSRRSSTARSPATGRTPRSSTWWPSGSSRCTAR